MPFTPFSTPIEGATFVQPIPLDALATGLQSQERDARSNIANIENSLQKIAGIPAYGKDAEVLSQKLNTALEGINKLSQSSDLSDPRIASQLKGHINSMSNDPDVLAIAKRGNLYAQESKRLKEATEKGKTYVSPILDGLTNYYNENTYYRDPQGLTYEQGFSPDMNGLMKAAKELTPVKKTWKTLPNGERMQIEGQDANELSSNYLNLINNDPNAMRYMKYQFDKENQGVNWDLEGQNKVSNDLNTLRNAKYQAIAMGYDPTVFDQRIKRLERILQSGLTGENLKNRYFNDYIADKAIDFGEALTYENQGDIKLDELNKMYIEHQYRNDEKLYEKIAQGAAALGIKKPVSEMTADELKQSAEKAQQLNLDLFKAKEDIKQEDRVELLDKRIKEGKLKGTTNKSAAQILDGLELGSLNLDQSKLLQNYLDANRELYGLEEGSDIRDVKIQNGKIVFEQDLSWKPDMFYDEVESIPVSKVIENIKGLDNTSSQTDNTNKKDIGL